MNDNQIAEIAKLPRGVAVIYQNNWVEAVLCHFDKYAGKRRPYKRVNKNRQSSLPQDIFSSNVFKEEGFKELKKEDVDSVHAWIQNSKYANQIKRTMEKALRGEALSDEERQNIAYYVFEGTTVIGFLRRAVTEEEGIKHADCYIQNITGIDDNTIVEIIRQLIIQKYIAYQGESDIAKRYVEYSEKIR